MSAKGFDKNSIIGLVLIGAILLIFSVLSKPSEEELKAKEEAEKLEKAKQEQLDTTAKSLAINKDSTNLITPDSLNNNTLVANTGITNNNDSINQINAKAALGDFADAINGEKQNYTIENEKIKVSLSNKGGRVASVELKGFHTYDSLPLFLFHEDSSRFNMELILNDGISGNKPVNTENLYFESTGESFKVEGDQSKSISMRLYYGGKDSYLEYKYTLSGNSYLLDFEVNTVGLDKCLSKDFPSFALNWKIFTPNQEKTIINQQQKSTIYYKYFNGDVDYIFETKYEGNELDGPVNWLMFKQQYFNSTLISKGKPFNVGAARESEKQFDIETLKLPENTTNYVQGMSTYLEIPYETISNESFPMQFYFGPNRYENLKEIGIGLEESLDYGWGVFGWVNFILIRPVFAWLNSFNLSIGIIILLLTLIIKMILFPITWKTYLSSAKMRVLKPEIAEITEKHGNDKMKKQQATMALYRQTGVNPLAGCIPMLIQMPILFALFRFFPATFDLRQKSFLWAEDLSTYDSIYDLGFNIPMYGDHISLFTLLMAISMIFYTRANSQMTAGAGMEGAMASQMKIMMYLMPVMMLFFFNSYAAGLSLYYLIANCITIGQQFIIRKWIVDEDKLRAKLQANKGKTKKKTGFAAKLEKRMKEAQEMQNKRKR